MTELLRHEICEEASKAGKQGIAMGQLVETLTRAGYPVETIELAIWDLMARRALTPSGFLCRVVRRRDRHGQTTDVRCYELLLCRWSPEHDRQLDLDLQSPS